MFSFGLVHKYQDVKYRKLFLYTEDLLVEIVEFLYEFKLYVDIYLLLKKYKKTGDIFIPIIEKYI